MPYTKTNPKWISDPNIRANTVKLLEENIRVNLSDVRLSNDFLEMILNAQVMKED